MVGRQWVQKRPLTDLNEEGTSDMEDDPPLSFTTKRQREDDGETSIAADTTDAQGKATTPGDCRYLVPPLLHTPGEARQTLGAAGSRTKAGSCSSTSQQPPKTIPSKSSRFSVRTMAMTHNENQYFCNDTQLLVNKTGNRKTFRSPQTAVLKTYSSKTSGKSERGRDARGGLQGGGLFHTSETTGDGGKKNEDTSNLEMKESAQENQLTSHNPRIDTCQQGTPSLVNHLPQMPVDEVDLKSDSEHEYSLGKLPVEVRKFNRVVKEDLPISHKVLVRANHNTISLPATSTSFSGNQHPIPASSYTTHVPNSLSLSSLQPSGADMPSSDATTTSLLVTPTPILTSVTNLHITPAPIPDLSSTLTLISATSTPLPSVTTFHAPVPASSTILTPTSLNTHSTITSPLSIPAKETSITLESMNVVKHEEETVDGASSGSRLLFPCSSGMPTHYMAPSRCAVTYTTSSRGSWMPPSSLTSMPSTKLSPPSSQPDICSGQSGTGDAGELTKEEQMGSSMVLQVDSWSNYLLQQLELLYSKEAECDLCLKFSSGETLKVHRAVVTACTCLATPPFSPAHHWELLLPSEMSYDSVAPVVRFIYSGRLEVRGSRKEVSAIYTAAQKLQVPPLMRLLLRSFPFLSPSTRANSRLPVWRRNVDKPFCQLVLKPQEERCGERTKDTQQPPTSTTTQHPEHQLQAAAAFEGDLKVEEVEKEEEVGDDVGYLLVTNSQRMAEADAARWSKRLKEEEARPTRFEFEDDTDNSWPSKPPCFPPSNHPHAHHLPSPPTTFCSSSSSSSSIVSVVMTSMSKSGEDAYTFTDEIADTSNASDGNNYVECTQSFHSSDNNSNVEDAYEFTEEGSPVGEDQQSISVVHTGVEPQGTHTVSPQVLLTVGESKGCDTVQLTVQDSCQGMTADLAVEEEVDEEEEEEEEGEEEEVAWEESGEAGRDDLMETITSICKQLEERDADDTNSSPEKACSTTTGPRRVISGSDTSNTKLDMTPTTQGAPLSPVKSILKKRKDKKLDVKQEKHVSFPLDENNELINEVATYSLAREPAHSLLEVQSVIGGSRPHDHTLSPVKLTLSLKKKVLMNLSRGEGDTIIQGSQKGRKRKVGVGSASSSAKLGTGEASKGEVTSHARIISEVLKKYPHLVKDKNNIRLKILKKGRERSSGGKLLKSRVQYLLLSKGETKGKSSGKPSTSSSTMGRNSHPPRVAKGSNLKYECCECKEVFNTYFTLKKHVTEKHKENSSMVLSKVGSVPYACFTCFTNEPLEFLDYYSYQLHMKEVHHTKNETRSCNQCGFRPARKLDLAYHQYTEHKKVPRNISFPKCDLCGFVAPNNTALLKHRSRHTNASTYTCSVCGLTFCSFGALQGHMQTRLCQSKPSVSHKCPHCPLTFARSYNLKAHCRSTHRSVLITTTSVPATATVTATQSTIGPKVGAASFQPGSCPVSSGTGDCGLEAASVDLVSDTLPSFNHPVTSGSKALSTVACSLAASLSLPEEAMTNYLHTQDGHMEVGQGQEENSKVSQSAGPSFQEDQVKTLTSTTPTNTGSVAVLGVVQGQLLPGQMISNTVLQGNSNSQSPSSVVGLTPHGWTYLTYQVAEMEDGEEPPAVVAETPTLCTDAITSEDTACELPTYQVSTANLQPPASLLGSPHAPSSKVITNETCMEQKPEEQCMSPSVGSGAAPAEDLSPTQSYEVFPTQFV